MIKFLSALILLLVTTAAQAERIRDLASVQGVRQNSLIGYGLVVGLDGTGDQTTQTPFTTQTLNNMLSQLGITVPTGTNMQLKNVAAVMVTASLPPFGRQGQTIDVVVSSMGNAKSLRGGTLLMTPLKGVDSQVYALAQGNILVGGAGASAGGSSVQVNQLNGGRITNGAVIERELPSQFGVGNTLNLQLNDEDFSMAQQIADTINRVRGYGSATALDARTIQVRVPSGNSSQVRFLADIQNIPYNRRRCGRNGDKNLINIKQIRGLDDFIPSADHLNPLDELSHLLFIIIDDTADDHSAVIAGNNFLYQGIAGFPRSDYHDRNIIFPVLYLMLSASQETV